MIEGNCSKAIESTEVILSQEGGPYAFQAILSWCIVSSLGEKNGTTKFNLHRNIFQCSSIFNNQATNHFFAVEALGEDTGTNEMFLKLYNEEFNEVQPERKHGVFGELEKLSSEDKQFVMMMMMMMMMIMMMMKNGIEFVNCHYQLPLPLDK